MGNLVYPVFSVEGYKVGNNPLNAVVGASSREEASSILECGIAMELAKLGDKKPVNSDEAVIKETGARTDKKGVIATFLT